MNQFLVTAFALVSLLGFSGDPAPALAGGCAGHAPVAQVIVKDHHVAEAIVVNDHHAVAAVVDPGYNQTIIHSDNVQLLYSVGDAYRQEVDLERQARAFAELVRQQLQATSKTVTTTQQTTANFTAPPPQYQQPQQQNLGQHHCDCGHCDLSSTGRGPTHQGPAQGGSDGSSASDPPVFSQTAPAPTLVDFACAECHNNETSAGGLSFLEPLTEAQRQYSIERVLDGTMPKDNKLTDAQKQQLAAALRKR